jgi:hypothetical protein
MFGNVFVVMGAVKVNRLDYSVVELRTTLLPAARCPLNRRHPRKGRDRLALAKI